MGFSCFGRPNGNALQQGDDGTPSAPRPLPNPVHRNSTSRTGKSTSKRLHRHASAGSHLSSSSWTSNESISRLPPVRRDSDTGRIEAKMMPAPFEAQPSRCLRLSHPKTYSALVSDMKACKGTRDWRNFAVFDDVDVDDSVSAEDKARLKARDYALKVKMLDASFGSRSTASDGSVSVDMIG